MPMLTGFTTINAVNSAFGQVWPTMVIHARVIIILMIVKALMMMALMVAITVIKDTHDN